MSSDGSDTILPIDVLKKVAGPFLLGHLLNWGMFGVLSTQVYTYHLAFPNDPRRSKALTYGVYLLEATQTILITQASFHAFVEGFGTMRYLDDIGNLWFSMPIMCGIVACIIQSFYAYRIYVLSGSKLVSGIVMFLSGVSLAGAVATGILFNRAVFFSKVVEKHSLITTGVWNGASTLCDAIIAMSMTLALSSRNTGMERTQTRIRKVIRLTIETGSLTAAVATLNLVLILLPNCPTFWKAPVGILGKLYSTSMMAVFNSRIIFAHESSRTSSVAPLELSRGSMTRSRLEKKGRPPSTVEIQITQEHVRFPSDDLQLTFWDDKSPVQASFELAPNRRLDTPSIN